MAKQKNHKSSEMIKNPTRKKIEKRQTKNKKGCIL
jgi:hypothetical protein